MPVAVVVDGRPLPAYVRAYVARGRAFVPLEPLLSRVTRSFWFDADGGLVVLRADGSLVRVRLPARLPEELDVAYVPIAPVLRAIGVDVDYLRSAATLEVRTPGRAAVATPTPYAAPSLPQPARAVFTPQPVPTPRPVWSGPPVPRRTPLPYQSPEPTGTKSWHREGIISYRCRRAAR